MIMPTYIISNKDIIQNNYNKLKEKDSFIWSISNSFKTNLIPGTEWLVINQAQRIAFLAVVKMYVSATHGANFDITSVDGKDIEGDFADKIFIKSDILEEYALTQNFNLPSLGAGVGTVLFDLSQKNKTRIIATRNALLDEIPTTSKLFSFLKYDEALDDCIALKLNNKWGFLFYTINKQSNKYTFNFVPVNNTGVTPSQEGYKDFVYFIASLGHPRAIKIGRSDNPTKRLKGLDGSNPATLNMLLVLPDGRKEKMYHRKFGDYRMYGKEEWFWDDEEIRNYIKKEVDKYKRIESIYIKSKGK